MCVLSQMWASKALAEYKRQGRRSLEQSVKAKCGHFWKSIGSQWESLLSSYPEETVKSHAWKTHLGQWLCWGWPTWSSVTTWCHRAIGPISGWGSWGIELFNNCLWLCRYEVVMQAQNCVSESTVWVLPAGIPHQAILFLLTENRFAVVFPKAWTLLYSISQLPLLIQGFRSSFSPAPTMVAAHPQRCLPHLSYIPAFQTPLLTCSSASQLPSSKFLRKKSNRFRSCFCPKS